MINKCVILAGGRGTRFLEETNLIPKPMITIGNIPIIQRIMQHYSKYGINHFIICGGYKINVIKDYFINFSNYHNDIRLDFKNNEIKNLSNVKNKKWIIDIIDTGDNSMTGGRLKRVHKYIEKNENFCFTYGDGISDVNIKKLIQFHLKFKKIATMTAVKPPGRYGAVDIKRNFVTNFKEKPSEDGSYINGGFFVLSQKIFQYIKNDATIFEKSVLEKLTKQNQLTAYKHDGFWQAMDSLRDKVILEELYKLNKLPFS